MALSEELLASFGSLSEMVKNLKGDITVLQPAVKGVIGSFGSLGTSLQTGASSIVSMASGYAGAISGVIDTIQGMMSQVASFVAPFDPGLVQVYNRALADTTAVIGSGLVPVLHVCIDIVKMFGDTLIPIMEMLKPTIATLMVSVKSLAIALIGTVGVLASALEPLFSVLSDIVEIAVGIIIPVLHIIGALFKVLSPLLQALSAILTVLLMPFKILANLLTDLGRVITIVASGFASAFNIGDATGKLKDTINSVVSSFRQAIAVLLKFGIALAAIIAQTLGSKEFSDSFIDGMLKSLNEGKKTGKSEGMATPGSASFSSFKDFGRGVSTAAFSAGRGGQSDAEKQIDVLKGIEETLKDIREGRKDLKTIIVEAIQEAGKAIGQPLEKGAKTGMRWGWNPLNEIARKAAAGYYGIDEDSIPRPAGLGLGG
jgi:hypothetical protein